MSKQNFGMPNMGQLMKQAQKMQKQMEEAQEKLADLTVTATVGGGIVEVVASANKEIRNVKIKEEAVDPDDIETLEDLVMTAVNEALRQAEELSQKEMAKITGGNLPPGMGGLF
ncbi:YbaB/EbfC family nucleoid-associated protein [Candidatus Epulonipiscium viviparus]|uniref:YbaB/EbfC family nucleoid-associated protein n=1 Tax=Candidatus Epulonipiscium viviparus TaxID=420336 RepID=UPI00273814A5|nr:YbaB/EbfC family nucleoid-associated protein [Candidatus Epulopiscium viviparus]